VSIEQAAMSPRLVPTCICGRPRPTHCAQCAVSKAAGARAASRTRKSTSARDMRHFLLFLSFGDLVDLPPFELKIVEPVTSALGHVQIIQSSLVFVRCFCFPVRSLYGTDGRTDRRRGKTRSATHQDGRI